LAAAEIDGSLFLDAALSGEQIVLRMVYPFSKCRMFCEPRAPRRKAEQAGDEQIMYLRLGSAARVASIVIDFMLSLIAFRGSVAFEGVLARTRGNINEKACVWPDIPQGGAYVRKGFTASLFPSP
jgi:hypothetical protein